jgi:hypothetical protein
MIIVGSTTNVSCKNIKFKRKKNPRVSRETILSFRFEFSLPLSPFQAKKRESLSASEQGDQKKKLSFSSLQEVS